MTRADSIQPKIASRRMKVGIEPLDCAEMFWLTMAMSRNDGTTRRRSMTHRATLSNQPPKYAAALPTTAATVTWMPATLSPMTRDLRSPSTVMAKTSDPSLVVPSQWSALGGELKARKSDSV